MTLRKFLKAQNIDFTENVSYIEIYGEIEQEEFRVYENFYDMVEQYLEINFYEEMDQEKADTLDTFIDYDLVWERFLQHNNFYKLEKDMLDSDIKEI